MNTQIILMKRDAQIVVRLPAQVKREIELEAKQKGLSVADVVLSRIVR